MREIRNSSNKLVCRIDPESLRVEIVTKGQKTVIIFDPGKEVIVTNTSLN